MAQRFEQDNRRLLGEPIDLGRKTAIAPHNQQGMLAVSAEGPLVYRTTARIRSRFTWIDRDGSARGTIGGIGVYLNLDMSPDGRRLAVSRVLEGETRTEFDIWTVELATGAVNRLTDDYPAWHFDPTWSPDGSQVAFNDRPIPTRGSFGLSALASDVTGKAEPLVPPDSPGISVSGPDWSKSNVIVYQSEGDLWTIDMAGDRHPNLFLGTKYSEGHATLSPNGRWLAFRSDSSSEDEPDGTASSRDERANPAAEPNLSGWQAYLWPCQFDRCFAASPGCPPSRRWR